MRVSIAEQVYAEQIEGETVLLELDTGRYFGLDAVGSRLWQLLTELQSTEAVAQAAFEEYDVSLDELTRDLHALVQSLAEHKLIVLEDAPAANC